jgi:hypothetical protein
MGTLGLVRQACLLLHRSALAITASEPWPRKKAPMIPLIDIALLYGPPGRSRRAAEEAVLAAATGSGFMIVSVAPEFLPATAANRAQLPRIFGLLEAGNTSCGGKIAIYAEVSDLQGNGPNPPGPRRSKGSRERRVKQHAGQRRPVRQCERI